MGGSFPRYRDGCPLRSGEETSQGEKNSSALFFFFYLPWKDPGVIYSDPDLSLEKKLDPDLTCEKKKNRIRIRPLRPDPNL